MIDTPVPFEHKKLDQRACRYLRSRGRSGGHGADVTYLERMRLPEQANKFPRQLYGGQQRRMAIVRLLCMNLKIMLFHEPTSTLDPKTVKEVLDLMVKLAEEIGVTKLCVRHE